MAFAQFTTQQNLTLINTYKKVLKRMLIQEKHLISFKSGKLKDVKKKYSTYEKKMTVIVLNAKEYRVYLLGLSSRCKRICCSSKLSGKSS
jgi:hypothetical protein